MPSDTAAPITAAEEWQRALEAVGAITSAWRMDLFAPTPHDYKAARVQLRREGWADPLPIAAIDHRARALAAGAWWRTLKGGKP